MIKVSLGIKHIHTHRDTRQPIQDHFQHPLWPVTHNV